MLLDSCFGDRFEICPQNGLNNRQGSLNCLRTFEDGGQHIQAFFGEGLRINGRMLQLIEPVRPLKI